MTKAEKKFVDDLHGVSASIAEWACNRIKNDMWSIADCKLHILNAAKVAGRE